MIQHYDNTCATIKEVVDSIVLDSRVYLFGSHARGEASDESDYDILVITDQTVEPKSKLALKTHIRKRLLDRAIRCDVLIQSEQEVQVKKDLPGHVIRSALREGVPL